MGTASEALNNVDYRLPVNVKPVRYDIALRTDLEKLYFWGYESILLEVLQDTSTITLNAVDVELSQIFAVDENNVKYPAISVSLDKDLERISFRFNEIFQEGSSIQLNLSWHAKIGVSVVGYYPSSYDHDGVKKYYAMTHFEPTAARRAFPCFDEPLLKSRFSISHISRVGTIALGNMPSISEFTLPSLGDTEAPEVVTHLLGIYKFEDDDRQDWKVTVLDQTPPMSTYVIAFANGPFDFLEGSYTSPLSGIVRPLRVYATSDVIQLAQFALDVKTKALPAYETMFGVEFPLPKLDTLISADYTGAMENWGLIIGGASIYLYDPNKSGYSVKRVIAETQTHEVAHMWFGDITTMEWWDSLWLNEGFASLMGDLVALRRIFPEFSSEGGFFGANVEPALQLDAQRSSHPVQVDASNPKNLTQFDTLSYSKAASVLRMLLQYVGEDIFLESVSLYLKKHLYANTRPNDLWEAIGEATGLGGAVVTMMNNWTTKIGYPVLSVSETEGGHHIHVRQDRFLSTGDPTPGENQTIWYTPLNFLSTNSQGESHVDRSLVLDAREKIIKVDTTKPFKFNSGASGFYRVAYTPGLLKKIGEWLSASLHDSNSPFSVSDRIQLISDAVALSKAGYGETSSALELIETLRDEKECKYHSAWESVAERLTGIKSLLWERSPEVKENFNAFQRFLFTPHVKKLGYEYSDDEPVHTRQLRTLAVTFAANASDPDVLEELQQRFARSQDPTDSSESIPPDLQQVIFHTAVQYGGVKEYEAMKLVWKNSTITSTKIDALRAMAASENDDLNENFFTFIHEELPIHQWRYAVSALRANHSTRRKLVAFVEKNHYEIVRRLDGNLGMGSIITSPYTVYTTEKNAVDMEGFFKDKDVSKYTLLLQQAFETVRVNSAWLQRSGDDIEGWLSDFNEWDMVIDA